MALSRAGSASVIGKRSRAMNLSSVFCCRITIHAFNCWKAAEVEIAVSCLTKQECGSRHCERDWSMALARGPSDPTVASKDACIADCVPSMGESRSAAKT